MFSRAKKRDAVLAEVDEQLAPPPVPSLDTEPARKGAKGAKGSAKAPAKPARAPVGVPSLISGDVIVRGTIESEGEVQFDGEIEGDIRALGLVIGEGARVAGEVVAEKVRVNGTVEGSIRATRVELAAGALVKGDVIHTALAIEAGARFEGNVRHSDDPIGAPAPIISPVVRTPEAPAPQAEPVPVAEYPASQPLARTARPTKPDLR